MVSTIALMAVLAASAPDTATAPPAPAPAAAPSLQEQYDRAVQLVRDDNCRAAIPALEELATRRAFRQGTLPGAMLAGLRGQCLIKAGRRDEGEEAIRAALPRLREEGEALKIDVAGMLVSLGDSALVRWDYAGARQAYEQARAMPGAIAPEVIHMKLAQAMAFDGGEAPLRHVDAAIQALETMPAVTDTQRAGFRTIRARILLNQGRHAEAYAELKTVLKLSGGLGLKVTLADIAIRGDLALAAQLSGDKTNARKYMAFTGQGRIAQSPFTRADYMEAPVCGTETGLRRDDFAVVEFVIGEDGQVITAQTVHTRGSAQVAAEFARAVSQWTWAPENLKEIPSFYLWSTRVELRCTTASQQAAGIMSPLAEKLSTWIADRLGPSLAGDEAALGARVEAAMRTQAASGPDPDRAALLARGALTLPLNEVGRDALLDAAQRAAGETVPPGIRAALAVFQSRQRYRQARARALPPVSNKDLMALLERPDIAGDAIAASTLRLIAATPGRSLLRRNHDPTLLRQVADEARLPARHPLRQVAQLRLANLAAREGDFAAAQAHFAATGLSEEQCAYLDVKPALRVGGFSSDEYPEAAAAMGFEGWVRLEYDIDSGGRTAGTRALMAYPPFVFSEPAVTSARDMRFESSYRPSGETACAASSRTINYRTSRW